MKKLVVASQKGGSGKTTITAHFGIIAGGKAVLIDSDPQESLSSWWSERDGDDPPMSPGTLRDLPSRLQALDEAFDVAVIDTAPGVGSDVEAIIKLADLVLIPVKASPHDLKAAAATVDLCKKNGKAFVFVVTQVKSNALITAQAVAALSEHGTVSPVLIGDRVEFASTMIGGGSVIEDNPRGMSAKELTELWSWVAGRLGVASTKKARKKEVAK